MSDDDERSLELFRLRYTLREACQRGICDDEVREALDRLRELALADATRRLVFEYNRWIVQLGA